MSRKSKHICAECSSWEMGDTWRSNMGSGPTIVSEGSCKGTGRAVLSAHHACQHFNRRKRTGFIMSGTGPMTRADLVAIENAMREIIEDNFPKKEDIKQETR